MAGESLLKMLFLLFYSTLNNNQNFVYRIFGAIMHYI